jgi:hypothetical protein
MFTDQPKIMTGTDKALIYKMALEKIANYHSEKEGTTYVVQAYIEVLQIAKQALEQTNSINKV